MKKKEKSRILVRLLAKDLSNEELKQVAGGSLSTSGGREYDDTDGPQF
jgi:hypothetical protein